MTRDNRVNIKTDADTRERLKRHKRSDESWTDLLNRLAEYAEIAEQ